MKTLLRNLVIISGLSLLSACAEQEQQQPKEQYDVIIRQGTIYDGSGGEPYVGDVAIRDDRIAAIGDVGDAEAETEIDATGKAVSPGFINMMSWAVDTLLVDGRGQSDIRQGITLEVMGEGMSWGPLNDEMKQLMRENQGDIKYDVSWTTLGEYLEHMENKGVSPNVASFIGAASPRMYVIGRENRAPTAEELAEMQDLVREAMKEGAMGVASSLIYPPGFYAKTDELIALTKAAGEYGGMYASHMRSEGNSLFEAMDELITIAREAGVRAEIYHLKQGGKNNWHKLDGAIAKIEEARAEGLEITADMYTYPAASTGLTATLPPWTEEGSEEEFLARLKDPETRAKIIEEMRTPTNEWEQMLTMTGADGILLVGFENDELKSLTGKTLAEVAAMRGTSPEDTIIDLLIEDESRIDSVYMAMSEDNVRRQIALPWMSFCTDSPALATEGVFLNSMTHPRAYGSFTRLLAKYVREEQIISLEEAIRKMTSLPAHNLRIRDRGTLKEGYYADILVFDPETVQDHATFAEPHQYSTGIQHVFVNGEQVLKDGEHTGALPGRVVRGPGWTGWQNQ